MPRPILSQQQAFFCACLLPLFCAHVVQAAITYHYSIDRGWWPVFLIFMTAVSTAYSCMATVLATIYRSYRIAPIARHATVLGLVLIAGTLVYFLAGPDWFAVRDDRLPWLIYLLSYVVLFLRFRGLSPKESA